MKMYKSDQLVIPFTLPGGMALRALADKEEVALATLVRKLIMVGITADPDLYAQYEVEYNRLKSMSDLELMQMKSAAKAKPKTKL